MYGSWAISKDNFSTEHMYEDHVLKYAAIDACATYWVHDYIHTQCDAIDAKTITSANVDWEAPF
jgi:hypothetical protein